MSPPLLGIIGALAIAVVGLVVLLRRSRRKLVEARSTAAEADATAAAVQQKYGSIINVEAEVTRMAAERDRLATEVHAGRQHWEQQYQAMMNELARLGSEVEVTGELAEMQSFGVYEPHFDFDSSEQFKAAIRENREHQKAAIKAGTAAVCDTTWTVEGSAAKGKKMLGEMLKLLLRAFNGECDAAVGRVRFDNVTKLEERIERAFTAINRLGKTNQCRLTESYMALKLAELRLTFERAVKKHGEKEEQRRIREEMREEERARKEIEKARAEAEEEEVRYEKALAKAREQLAKSTAAKHDSLKQKIQLLEQQLDEAHENKARAISRASLTRSGHVYVISNIGSFGEGTFKIGMTRRLEPLDRVKELGDSSVPFPFDVHAMVYSEDAPVLERVLHERFRERSVNVVNPRKEFFDVTLEEVERAVADAAGGAEFIRTAVAEEFRESMAIREKERKKKDAAAAAETASRVDAARSRFEELRATWKAEPV